MKSFMSDLDSLSREDLVRTLEGIAAAWRRKPALARLYSQRVRCAEITKALRDRFNATYYLLATAKSPHDYRVSWESPAPTWTTGPVLKTVTPSAETAATESVSKVSGF